jgi:hypothetical protein
VVPQKVEPLQVTLPSLPAAAQEAEKDGGAAGMSGMAVDPIVGVM